VSGSARGKVLGVVVAERWDRLISDLGPLSVARQVASYERVKVDPAGPPPQVFIREMFVPAEPALRRTLDLFCVGFIERSTPDGDERLGELVLVGPETIRTQTSTSADGLTVTDLRMGSAGPEIRTVSMMLMRINRTTRAHDIVISIEDLGRLLDYQNDVAGSTAVAHAIVRRLEVLAAATGTEVPVVGTIMRLGDAPVTDAHQHYLLVNSESPLSFDDDLTIRDGHLVIVGKDGRAAAWRGGDFVLVRFGQPPVRSGEIRSLAQLRREHALVEAALGRGKASTVESYSSRAADARQSSRAEQVVRHTLAGDTVRAAATFRAAAAEPGADGPLVASISDRVTSVSDYWLMSTMLTEMTDDIGASGALHTVVRASQERLDGRLDQLLSLASDSSEPFIPIVTPLVFEISDALVPFVDSNQDGGLFLYELIPAMRDRLLAGLGVSAPGVRARGNPSLLPGEFTIQIDEVLVETGTSSIAGSYALLPLSDGEPHDVEAELTDTHPMTGQSGLWQIKEVEEGAVEEGAEYLTLAQYLIHRIDMTCRTRLSRFLGPQEVASLVEEWTSAERDLVVSVLPDQGATVRLTWVLQALVEERIPITKWRVILAAIRDDGGITMPIRTLTRAVRARLNGQLPGPRSGSRVLRVPAPLQEAMAARLNPPGRPPDATTHEFQQWLRAAVISNSPVLSLVARDEGTRETVSVLARSQYELVTTFTEEELSSR
jgi:FHIPEP family